MSVPTEPGYYWAKVDGEWFVVNVTFPFDVDDKEPCVEVFGYKDLAPEVVTEWRRIETPTE